MNREIKFRGLGGYLDYDSKTKKHIKKSKWIYGSVIFGGGGEFPKTAQIWDKEGHNFSVDPETVGQYTGKKDQNKTEIYEDDILAKKKDSEKIWIIKWRKIDIQFQAYHYVWDIIDNETEEYGWVEKYKHQISPLINCYENFVIGNIHENKELKK